MRAEFITPFLGALSRTMSSTLGCAVHPGTLSTQCEKFHEVSAIVGISGKACGTMILSLSEHLATHIAAKMLMVETDGFNIDAVDAVGELATQIALGAKQELAEYELSTTLACVVTGRHHRVQFPSHVTPLSVVCGTDWGPLRIEVGLAPAPRLAEHHGVGRRSLSAC
jgi:chemotaxis protein CheX